MVYLIWYRMVKSYPAHDLHLGMLIETHSEMQRAHGNDLNLIQSALTCTVSHSQHISWVIIVILTTLVAKIGFMVKRQERRNEYLFLKYSTIRKVSDVMDVCGVQNWNFPFGTLMTACIAANVFNSSHHNEVNLNAWRYVKIKIDYNYARGNGW